MEEKKSLLCLYVDGEDYAGWNAENEIGVDELFRRDDAGEELVTSEEEREHGVEARVGSYDFSSAADCSQALELARDILDHMSRDRGRHYNCFLSVESAGAPPAGRTEASEAGVGAPPAGC